MYCTVHADDDMNINDTVYVAYFTRAIIELDKVSTFLILGINLDSKI